jgi:hypothetical protein
MIAFRADGAPSRELSSENRSTGAVYWDVDEITIPVGQPLTFDALRALNAAATTEELAAAFQCLPAALREQAWDHLRLRVALNDWNAAAAGESDQ